MHLLPCIALALINGPAFALNHMHARSYVTRSNPSVLFTVRDPGLGQTAFGAFVVLATALLELIHHVLAVDPATSAPAESAAQEASCAVRAGPAPLPLAVRLGLIFSLYLLCERLLYSLIGLTHLTLPVVALLRTAHETLPVFAGCMLMSLVLAVACPLALGTAAPTTGQLAVSSARRAREASGMQRTAPAPPAECAGPRLSHLGRCCPALSPAPAHLTSARLAA
jgi:hypothetical protein